MKKETPRIVAVVVSYNRRDLLRESLAAVSAQIRQVDGVVVVDNASTDGSADAAAELVGTGAVVRLERNVGGAGGFAVGLAVALVQHDADLVWLMDDDTVPSPTALAELERGMRESEAVVAASRVVWTDGSDHPMNTPRARLGRSGGAGLMRIRSASFVSMLVSGQAVKNRGLPIADYFIWNDDFEFSTRMIRGNEGVYVPASLVEHRTKRLVSTDDDPGERFFYEVRNKLWMYRCSRSLSPGEKVLYVGSTARRWARTFLRSKDRATLAHALHRGLAAGLRTRPRDNREVLAGLPVTGELTALEAAAE